MRIELDHIGYTRVYYYHVHAFAWHDLDSASMLHNTRTGLLLGFHHPTVVGFIADRRWKVVLRLMQHLFSHR